MFLGKNPLQQGFKKPTTGAMSNQLAKPSKAELDRLFSREDFGALRALAQKLRDDRQTEPEACRCYQLIGDLHRRRRNFRGALKAYREAEGLDPGNGVTYGMLECHSALGNRNEFAALFEIFIEQASYDENIWSRLMLACARLGLGLQFDRLADTARENSPDSEDARFWFRFAKALALFGEREPALALAERAARYCRNDSELEIEIATIEYDMKVYWELRYGASRNAPVPPSSREEEAYSGRTARDVAYLELLFGRLFGAPLDDVAECGCGSGRLTPFIHRWSGRLDCYDISGNAICHARITNPGLQGARYFERDLCADTMPAAHYDLVFDFTVVQHVSDDAKWEALLANYMQACRPGGRVVLVEQVAGPRATDALHLSKMPLERYLKAFESGGFECRLNERTPWHEVALCFEKPEEKAPVGL